SAAVPAEASERASTRSSGRVRSPVSESAKVSPARPAKLPSGSVSSIVRESDPRRAGPTLLRPPRLHAHFTAAARRLAAALTYRDFRLLWLGALTSSIGTWMQKVAQAWLIVTLTDTRSAFFLGLDAFLGELP